MTTRRAICFSLGGLLILAMVVIIAGLMGTGQMTRQMWEDPGYFRWTRGKAPLTPKYSEAFMRDMRFQRRFVGQPIEALRPFFPELQSGAGYDPASYRAKNVRTFLSNYAGTRFEDYWLEGTEREFGFCVLVVDGKIRDLFWVKG